jgi:hypothetical protein
MFQEFAPRIFRPWVYKDGNFVTATVRGVTTLPLAYADCLEILGVSNSWSRSYFPQDIPGIHFCRRLSRTQGHSAAGRIKSNSGLLVNFKNT